MRIYPKDWVELQMKYPNEKVKHNRLLSLEGRRDILLVHFRDEQYEIWYPPYTFSEKDVYGWCDDKKKLKNVVYKNIENEENK